MTDTHVPTTDDLKAALASAAPDLGEADQRIAVAVYRLLAEGEPVTAAAIAEASEAAEAEVETRLEVWPGVFLDEDRRVVGFWGLAISELPHRITVGGRQLYAWCAWDPMFLSLILGAVEVATDDPVTGEEISYRLADGHITDLSHPDSVLSFLRPDQPWDESVMETFCHFVVQFTDPDSASGWVADNPGTLAISLDDGVAIARHYLDSTFGAALQP